MAGYGPQRAAYSAVSELTQFESVQLSRWESAGICWQQAGLDLVQHWKSFHTAVPSCQGGVHCYFNVKITSSFFWLWKLPLSFSFYSWCKELYTVQLKLFKTVYHHHTNVYSLKKKKTLIKFLTCKQFYFVYFQPHSQVLLISILPKSTSKTIRVSHTEAALLCFTPEKNCLKAFV